MIGKIEELHVVSMGVGDVASLPESALHAIHSADVILGAEHHFTSIAELECKGTKELYATPFSLVKQQVLSFEGCIVVLASGDSLFFGIGSWINNLLVEDSDSETTSLQPVFHPNISSIQAACHLIGKPWQQLTVLSAHGRPLADIKGKLVNHCFYGLFTDKHSQPFAVANTLINAGFEQSTLWVCESIGTDQQRVRQYKARDLVEQGDSSADSIENEFHPLHVTLFETAGAGNILPEFPGILDTAFSTDGDKKGSGLLTKREVRINILSLLQPTADDIGWDVGAGCGGVSVEWARWNPKGKVYSIEYHPDRLPHLRENQQRFGVGGNLQIIEGRAPDALLELPRPQKVFVGGSGGELAGILSFCWDKLTGNGKLVIACVTENNKHRALEFVEQLPNDSYEMDISQLSVSRGDSIANQLILRPQLPVLLIAITKNLTACEVKA